METMETLSRLGWCCNLSENLCKQLDQDKTIFISIEAIKLWKFEIWIFSESETSEFYILYITFTSNLTMFA